jgi:hypothetical protein
LNKIGIKIRKVRKINIRKKMRKVRNKLPPKQNAESKNRVLSTLLSAGPQRNRPAAIASPPLSYRDEQSSSTTEIREAWRQDLANAKEQARQFSNFAEQAKNDIKTGLGLVRCSKMNEISEKDIWMRQRWRRNSVLILFCVHFVFFLMT